MTKKQIKEHAALRDAEIAALNLLQELSELGTVEKGKLTFTWIGGAPGGGDVLCTVTCKAEPLD